MDVEGRWKDRIDELFYRLLDETSRSILSVVFTGNEKNLRCAAQLLHRPYTSQQRVLAAERQFGGPICGTSLPRLQRSEVPPILGWEISELSRRNFLQVL